MSRAVLVCGGELNDINLLTDKILPTDYIIGVDRGCSYLYEANLTPDIAIGDFDSIYTEDLIKINKTDKIELNPEKDLTDTEVAVEYALSKGFDEILLLGATGRRLEHTLTNIHLLEKIEKAGVDASIIDDHSCVFLCKNNMENIVYFSKGMYISLIPLTDSVEGVTLKGFKYPLNHATLYRPTGLAVSNEAEQGKDTGSIYVKQGVLCVILTIE